MLMVDIRRFRSQSASFPLIQGARFSKKSTSFVFANSTFRDARNLCKAGRGGSLRRGTD